MWLACGDVVAEFNKRWGWNQNKTRTVEFRVAFFSRTCAVATLAVRSKVCVGRSILNFGVANKEGAPVGLS